MCVYLNNVQSVYRDSVPLDRLDRLPISVAKERSRPKKGKHTLQANASQMQVNVSEYSQMEPCENQWKQIGGKSIGHFNVAVCCIMERSYGSLMVL